MSTDSGFWFGQEAALYNGATSRSAKFNDDSSTYLNNTFGSSGNRRLWTFSAWVKKSTLDIDGYLLGANTSGAPEFIKISNSASDELEYAYWDGSAYTYQIKTTAVFRDITAWYHVVIAVDTAQGVASNRVKFYVNGTQITNFSISSYPSQDADTQINHSVDTRIGSGIGSNYFDGYMADVHMIDGSALAPTSFGETKNGVWIPKSPSGITYGTNGFRLEFKQDGTGSGAADTVGADTSGLVSPNHFDSSGHPTGNIVDNPENNFCTMNSIGMGGTGASLPTFSEGNLKTTGTTTAWRHAFGTIPINSGKWYFEARIPSVSGSQGYFFGIADPSNDTTDDINSGTPPAKFYAVQNTSKYDNDAASATPFPSISAGQIHGIAVDLDNNKMWVSLDGTWYNDDNSSTTLDASNEDWTIATSDTGHYVATGGNYGTGSTLIYNFGQDSSFQGTETATSNADENGYGTFHSAVPSGFLALCTVNLSKPTIGPTSTTQADDHFNVKTYTGDGSTQSITGVNFQPDLVWIKNRDETDDHVLTDSTRGVTKELQSSATGAESTNADGVTAFGEDGFSLGDDDIYNTDTEKYVAWCWKAGGDIADVTGNFIKDGVAFTPTQGTIDANAISVNTTSGFSIVTYNANSGTAATIAHGLGVAPKFMIIKNRASSQNWVVYHEGNTSAPATDYLHLNLNNATDDDAGFFNDTAPTSTVFSIGSNANVNNGTEANVAYVFSEIEGFSKIGSYVGNGDANGAFIYTGFKPKWVITKRTDSADNWVILDSGRSTYNARGDYLYAEASQAEDTHSTVVIDFLSNGFKCRGTATNINASGGAYVYIAFAEAPFKYANAG